MATGKVDQFDYGAGTYLEEHIFVSDPQNQATQATQVG